MRRLTTPKNKAPGAGIQQSGSTIFEQKIRLMFGSALIGYWPGDELSGTVAYDRSGRSRNGSYTNVALGQTGFGDGKTAGSYNGVSSQGVLLSAGLTSDFNGEEGTLVCFGRMSSGAAWTDSTARCLFNFAKSDYSQVFRVQKSNVANNLTWAARGKDAVFSGFTNDKDFCAGVSWSTLNNRIIPYYQGRPRGNPVTGLTAWGANTLGKAYLGSATLSMNFHSGLIGHLFLLNREITKAEMYGVFTMMKPNHKNITIIGDSISASSFGWAYRMADQYADFQNALFNHAISGHSVMTNMDAQCSEAASDNADIIIHQLGTNDDNSGNMVTLQAKMESNIALLKTTNPRAAQYYLGVIPRWTDVGGGTPTNKSNIRAAQKAACIAQDIPYLDAYAGSNILVTDTSDGTHLTEAGAEKLADWVREELKHFENGITYVLRDSFGTPRAAGAVNDTDVEPGPGGKRLVTDTGNKLSISNGKVTISGGLVIPEAGNPGLWYPGYSRVVGRATVAKVKLPNENGYAYFGHDLDQTSWGWAVFSFGNAGQLFIYDDESSGTDISIYGMNTDYELMIVNNAVGNFFLLKGGSLTEWTLLWISVVDILNPYYPAFVGYTGQITADDIRVVDLPSPWNIVDGLATDRIDGAVPENATFTHEANCSIEWIQTSIPTETNSTWIEFRRQDADNCWIVSVNDTGWFQLWELVSGVPTYRAGSGENAVTAGDRIVVIAHGQTIKGYIDNTLIWTYISAANFINLTAGAIFWQASISDLVTWPRTISGAALEALNKV